MKVEIWSDVVCPFCYIGKRKFEQALNSFEPRDKVEIVWRSFQLDPHTVAAPGKSQAQVLSEKKGWSLAQTEQMMAQVTSMAAAVGLNYNMDKAVVANTFNAHRLIHLAAKWGKQDAAEERLFQAYFIEGKDVGSKETLQQLGEDIGLPTEEVASVLAGNTYADAVQKDQLYAQQVGAQGVPFFVFNGKYAVSGAQSPDVFRQVLDKVWEEEKPVSVAEGGYCTPDGFCQ